MEKQNLFHGHTWNYKDLTVQGVSLAGVRTAFTIPQWGLCFDVAQGFPFVLNHQHYFITHGHLDHAAGIPYIITQKAMNSQKPGHFYMPEGLKSPMTQMMGIWADIEKHQYNFNFQELQIGDRVSINPEIEVQAFQTIHRVASLGYTVFKKHKKLKKDYAGLSGHELAELKKNKISVDDWISTPLVSFTGDTQIDFLDSAPDQVLNSEVLFLEATFIDEKKSVSSARQWGHTHLDEIVQRLSQLQNKKIVLIHLSSRYSVDFANKILDEKIPPAERHRFEIFPGR